MSVLRLTDEQYAAAQKRARKPPQTDTGRAFPASGVQPPSKYRNRATGGYASVKEARRAGELKLLLAADEVRNLREQVRYELIPKQGKERPCHYVADFVYEQDGATVVEDCKGMRTRDYIIKRKLMLHVHGIRIRET